MEEESLLAPPDLLLGDREVPPRGAGSYRGEFYFEKANVYLQFESHLELKFLTVASTWADVEEIRTQYPRVWFRNSVGHLTDHTFDAWVRFSNGVRWAINIKYSSKADDARGLVGKVIRSPEFLLSSDKACVITDETLTDGAWRNAQDILHARRYRDDAECRAVRKELRSLAGTALFHDLLRSGALEGVRRTALWNAIDDGLLVPVFDGRITDWTPLRSNMKGNSDE